MTALYVVGSVGLLVGFCIGLEMGRYVERWKAARKKVDDDFAAIMRRVEAAPRWEIVSTSYVSVNAHGVHVSRFSTVDDLIREAGGRVAGEEDS